MTHDVSVLAEGILGMKSTLVGIVKINPRKLLENGIRKELVSYISTAIHQHLQFSSSGTATVAGANDHKVSGSAHL